MWMYLCHWMVVYRMAILMILHARVSRGVESELWFAGVGVELIKSGTRRCMATASPAIPSTV